MNAAGGLNPVFEVGDFVVLDDQVVFPSIPDLSDDLTGNRLINVGSPYDPDLSNILFDAVESVTGKVKRGKYAYMMGPAYETWAEVEFLKTFGADVVGMSTALEALYAKVSGMQVAGLSLVTNVHHPNHHTPLTHEEVLKQAEKSREKFQEICNLFINNA